MLDWLIRWNPKTRDKWVAKSAVEIPEGSRVLDIGAGGCPYRHLLGHCIYKTHDFEQLESSKIAQGAYGRLDYVSDITEIPEEDATFDAILCTEVLEHVPDPRAALLEMTRLLRPGGTLLLTAPLGSGLHQQPFHFYGGYTPWWYEKFCAEAGLDIVSLEANHGSYAHASQHCVNTIQDLLFNRRRSAGRQLFAIAAGIAVGPCLLTSAVALRLLDRIDKDQLFTAGYFLKATKRE
jgi:SAM-dependent methyltransferase